MCGIHGLVQLDGKAVDPALLSRMGRVTAHRGPDDEGLHVDGNAGIAMRRLSIIDLAGGHQPISNADDSLWLVCNGEIYNYRELRSELQARGYRFKTGSDSEVLLHLYDAEGDAFVQRLSGMFDFALWDARRRRLLIGRDRLGVKPLYVRQDARPRRCWSCPVPPPSSTAARCPVTCTWATSPRRAASSGASASCRRPRCWRWKAARCANGATGGCRRASTTPPASRTG
jgi:asparagine synthetase B (glutamine-hydrolysing)